MEDITVIRKMVQTLKGYYVTKAQKEEILDRLTNIEKIINKPQDNTQDVHSKLDLILSKMGGTGRRTDEPNHPTQATYADVVRIDPLILVPKSVQRPEKSMAIVKEKIDIAKLGVGVLEVRSRPSGNLVIFPESAHSRDLLQKDVDRNLGNVFSTKVGRRKYPHVIIHDLPGDQTPIDVVTSLGTQNGITTHADDAKFVFSIRGREEGRRSMVMRVAPYVYQALMKRGKISVGWEIFRVKKFTPVARCYKCQGHGHLQGTCTGGVSCGRCAAAHPTRECTSDNVSCALCRGSTRFASAAATHPATSAASCPTIKFLAEIIDGQTDFGAIPNTTVN